MKRIITFFIAMAFIFSFSACKNSEPSLSENSSEPIKQQSADVENVWSELSGFWNNADTTTQNGNWPNLFVTLGIDENETKYFNEGMYETDFYNGQGRVTKLTFDGEDVIKAELFYEAREATEMNGAVPETTKIVIIDYSSKENGTIKVKIDDQKEIEYSFAGKDFDQAFKTYSDNIKR